jgi:hypothetical protein
VKQDTVVTVATAMAEVTAAVTAAAKDTDITSTGPMRARAITEKEKQDG